MSAACVAALLTLAAAATTATATATTTTTTTTTTPAIAPAAGMTLHRCGQDVMCGSLQRPLDPTGRVAGTLGIYFEYFPHTDPGQPRGTLVATEGGPGYPATESRADYLALFAPLRRTRDVVIMDNRGTGRSAAIDCRELQSGARWTVEAVAACGRELGARAPFFTTAHASDDLAALLAMLHVGKIDLFGDSYGTYFEQVFAARHPELLRSLVLDGAYPLDGPDYAWYPSYAPAMRAKFNLLCARSAACAAWPGDSLAHIAPVLDALRTTPYDASGYDLNGPLRQYRADASQLATVMFASAPALTGARELEAAARAFSSGDRAPLERLMAETAAAVDSRDPNGDPTHWSAGLAAAVMCQDAPQLYDMQLPPAERALDRERALAARRAHFPATYAPFSIDEFRGMPLDYSYLDQCVGWPVPASRASRPVAAAGIAQPAAASGTNVPVPALVISGEFDDITTPADGAAAAAALQGRQILIANSFHVNALPRARSPCAAGIVRRFLIDLSPGDTRCAREVPAVRLLPQFARSAAELEPVAALPGNAADRMRLQIATAALFAAGDAALRAPLGDGRALRQGLRGGTYTASTRGGGWRIMIDAVRWTGDVAISGELRRSGGREPSTRAALSVAGDRIGGRLLLRWQASGDVRISGTLGGQPIKATAPAPE